MSEGVIKEFTDVTQEEIRKIERNLAAGTIKDMAEYKGKCGEVRAYKRSIDNLKVIAERYFKEDPE